MFTYDPGFTSTGSCESKITYIDGDEGILLYRGYPIEQIAEHGDFLETCYLLLYGELPTPSQKDGLRLSGHPPHDGARADEPVLPGLPPRRPSDGRDGRLRRRALGLLSRLTDISDPHQRMVASIRMIAKMPTLAAMAYKYSIGQPFIYPKNELDYAIEFPAHVLRGAVRGIQAQSGAGARAWTASSFCTPITSRMPRPRRCGLPARRAQIRSPASPPACACLWGPAHGGANEAALKMLVRNRHGRAHPGVSSSAPRTRTIRSG